MSSESREPAPNCWGNMLEIYTFKNDDEANEFFRKNPYIFVVKFVANGNLQHYLITRNRNVFNSTHLQTEVKTVNGSAVRNFEP